MGGGERGDWGFQLSLPVSPPTLTALSAASLAQGPLQPLPPMALLVPTPGGPGLGRPQANPTLPGTGPRWAWPGGLSPLPVTWLVFQPSFLTVIPTHHLMTDPVTES